MKDSERLDYVYDTNAMYKDCPDEQADLIQRAWMLGYTSGKARGASPNSTCPLPNTLRDKIEAQGD